MHSTIFELQPTPLRKEEWATENNFVDNHNIDYCMLLDGERRDERIESLYNSAWFNKLFRVGDEKDTIIYRGKDALNSFKREWYEWIQKKH